MASSAQIVEQFGYLALEIVALREGLSIARPAVDADGIDSLIYEVQCNDQLTAVGVQVKSYTNRTWRIDTKYPPDRVMFYVWNAGQSAQRVFAMRARTARSIAWKHTSTHNTRGGQIYNASAHNYWTTPKASRDFIELIQKWEVTGLNEV